MNTYLNSLVKDGFAENSSLALSLLCPGYIFLSGSALSGCDNWCDVTELVWLRAGAATLDQSEAWLAAPRLLNGCQGSVQVESRAVINLVTMEPAQRHSQVDRAV